MRRILVTGATGFAGSHLIDHLLTLSDYEIHGTTRKSSADTSFPDSVILHSVDLENKDAVRHLIQTIRPTEVYHLAAQASVPLSIKNPAGTFHANIDSQINLFESLRDEGLDETKILLVSSAEVYGYIKPEDLPINENTPHRPANPYAVSKIAQDYLGFQYHLSYKMPIVRVRPFNHAGPGQAPIFVMADFAKQVAEIEKGKKEPLMRVGNMAAKRDFTDVRDMVRLYPLLLQKGQPGEVYNAGSGSSHSAQEILDLLFSLSKVSIKVESDPSKMRPSDTPEIVADITKVKSEIGWEPTIPFEQTVKDTLEYFRNVV